MKKIRCAIYTRKSSEDGLEQDFNSLDAQREACASYIASQKHEGWELLPQHYDDGGKSGGTLDRPALHRLLNAIDRKEVDQIVVYKIDRLTRSLVDFAKLVERLDEADASFVSVTQSFNTATSMGRLTLNVLLSFAQFEREVTAERIRDKIGASKKKGLWMGGSVPLGYQADGRTLAIFEEEATIVSCLYDWYLEHGSAAAVADYANAAGLRTKKRITQSGSLLGGNPFTAGHIYYILGNPVYAGMIRHKDKIYQGNHPPIIDRTGWEKVQAKLASRAPYRRGRMNQLSEPSILSGKLYCEADRPLKPTHTKKGNTRYRYYISRHLAEGSNKVTRTTKAAADHQHSTGWRLPAKELEAKIKATLLNWLKTEPISELLPSDVGMDTIRNASIKLRELAADKGDSSSSSRNTGTNCSGNIHHWADLIQKITIQPGQMNIRLDTNYVAEALGVDKNNLAKDVLEISAPFQHRKRGVETKLVIENLQHKSDQTLIANIAKAGAYYDAIKQGSSYKEIARQYGTSKHRIQQVMHLAFLAPDIVSMIERGKQPIELTSAWLIKYPLPSDWVEQREVIARLL